MSGKWVSRILLVGLLLPGCIRVYVAEPRSLTLPLIDTQLETISYPSGLRVIVEPDTRTPLAGAFLLVGSGSTSDPVGKEGLAHFVANLTLRSRPAGAGTVREMLDRSGSVSFDAVVSFDSTTDYELGLASALPELLRIEGARLIAPVVNVTSAEEEAERAAVVNELRLANETGVTGEVLNKLQAALFPAGHPYARPLLGTHQTLAALDDGDVQAFVKANYRPDNMTMLILGNVELSTVAKLVEENLPNRLLAASPAIQLKPRMTIAPPPVPEAPPQGAALPSYEAEVSAPELWIGWSLPRSFGSDAHLLSFLVKDARRQLVHAMIDDQDIAGLSTQVVSGVHASMLLCRVALQTGAHPRESRDRILKEVAPLEGRQGVWYGSAAESAFRFEREEAILDEALGAQNLISRGLRRVTSVHFAEIASSDAAVVPNLIAMRQQQLWDFANPYFTAERAKSLLVVPVAGRAGAPPALAARDPDETKADAPELPMSGLAAVEKERLHALLPDLPRTVYRLPNGLAVFLEPREGLPLVSAAILVPSVPKDANEEVAAVALGTAGRVAHVLNSPGTFGARIDQVQAADHLSWFVDGARPNLEGVLAALAEYVQAVSIDREGWLDFRNYSVPLLERDERDPSRQARRWLLRSLFADSPYSKVAGAAALEGGSRSAVNGWIRRTLAPANAVLALSGDFDTRDAKKLIDATFGRWSGSPEPALAPAPPAVSAGDAFDAPADARGAGRSASDPRRAGEGEDRVRRYVRERANDQPRARPRSARAGAAGLPARRPGPGRAARRRDPGTGAGRLPELRARHPEAAHRRRRANSERCG